MTFLVVDFIWCGFLFCSDSFLASYPKVAEVFHPSKEALLNSEFPLYFWPLACELRIAHIREDQIQLHRMPHKNENGLDKPWHT